MRKSYIVGIEYTTTYWNRVEIRIEAKNKKEARKRAREAIANGELDYGSAWRVGDSCAGKDKIVDIKES